jgi:hypothetical protein
METLIRIYQMNWTFITTALVLKVCFLGSSSTDLRDLHTEAGEPFDPTTDNRNVVACGAHLV